MRLRRLSSVSEITHIPSGTRPTSGRFSSPLTEQPGPPSQAASAGATVSSHHRLVERHAAAVMGSSLSPRTPEYSKLEKGLSAAPTRRRIEGNSYSFFWLLGLCSIAGLFFVVLTVLSICADSAASLRAPIATGLPGLRGVTPAAASDTNIDAGVEVIRRVMGDSRYTHLLSTSITKLLLDSGATVGDPRLAAATLAESLVQDWNRLAALGDGSDKANGGGARALGALTASVGPAEIAESLLARAAVDAAAGDAANALALHAARSAAAAAAAKATADAVAAAVAAAAAAAIPPPAAVAAPGKVAGAIAAMMGTAPEPAKAPVAPERPLLAPNMAYLGDGRLVDTRYTQQTCHLAGDESELCKFEGVFCFDGNHPTIVTDSPPPYGPLNPVHDPNNDCMDYRFSEVSSWAYSSCRYDRSGDRPYDWHKPHAPATDHPIDLTHRYMGPNNRREVLLHEVAPIDVFPDVARGWDSVFGPGAGGTGPFDHPAVPGLRIQQRHTMQTGVTVDYIDSALWLLAINGQSFTNPYMFFAATSQLFAAQRSNMSSSAPPVDPATGTPRVQVWGDHPHDATVHRPFKGMEFVGQSPSIFRAGAAGTPNTAKFVVGAQWDLPPIDKLVYLGSGGLEIDHRGKLGAWFGSVLNLSAQAHTDAYFNNIRREYNASHLLCARRGAMPSQKPRMFTTGADAWMFRQYAYNVAGLSARSVLTHSMYPPRRITILDRKGLHGRGIFNRDEVLAAANATGLEVVIIGRMDHMTFAQQVDIMAGTGILIACHGAALMNTMFMPAHAVVIELFPPLMKINVYRNLAATMGLMYMPVYTRQALPVNFTQFMGSQIMARPEYAAACTANNITSYDAMLQRWCNWASKTHPIIVPIRVLKRHLDDAVDAIGAFSQLNPEWKDLSAAQGIPPPTRLAMMADDTDVEDSPSLRSSYKEAWATAATYSPSPI